MIFQIGFEKKKRKKTMMCTMFDEVIVSYGGNYSNLMEFV